MSPPVNVLDRVGHARVRRGAVGQGSCAEALRSGEYVVPPAARVGEAEGTLVERLTGGQSPEQSTFQQVFLARLTSLPHSGTVTGGELVVK